MNGIRVERVGEVADVRKVIESFDQLDDGLGATAVESRLRAVPKLLGELRPREGVSRTATRDVHSLRANRFAIPERHLYQGVAPDSDLGGRAVLCDSYALHDGAHIGSGNGTVVERAERHAAVCESGGHCEIPMVEGSRYYDAVIAFVHETGGRAQGAGRR